jgi:exodeoxyribonuclease VII large subunit
MDKLLKNYPAQIQIADGEYHTANKKLQWPKVLQRVALIAAAGSDGQRDFMQELLHNQYGYHFELTLFTASVQGQQAVAELTTQLDEIHQMASSFDVVAIVRGGGSNTDFAAFDDYEVARRIAVFPIPVFTGIGHDRNTSIADLMAWQFKTPTKVAAAIVDTALRFENDLQEIQENIETVWQEKLTTLQASLSLWNNRMQLLIPHRLQRKKERLQDWQLMIQKTSRDQLHFYGSALKEKSKRLEQQKNKLLLQKGMELQQLKRMVEQLSPESILNRGFAMVMQGEKIMTEAAQLDTQLPMKTILKNNTIISDIKAIEAHE